MSDQAVNLRRLVDSRPAQPAADNANIINITGSSGLDSVRQFAADFSRALAVSSRVLVLDMHPDGELAKLMGVDRYDSIELFVSGQRRIEEIARRGGEGAKYLACGKELYDLADTDNAFARKAEEKFVAFCSGFDHIILTGTDTYDSGDKCMMGICGVCLLVMTLGSEIMVDTFRLLRSPEAAGVDVGLVIYLPELQGFAKATAENFMAIAEKSTGSKTHIAGWIQTQDSGEYERSVQGAAKEYFNGRQKSGGGMRAFLKELRKITGR